MLHLEKITRDELLHMMRASAMKLTDIRTQYLENVRAYHDIEFPAQEYTLRNSWTKVDVYDAEQKRRWKVSILQHKLERIKKDYRSWTRWHNDVHRAFQYAMQYPEDTRFNAEMDPGVSLAIKLAE